MLKEQKVPDVTCGLSVSHGEIKDTVITATCNKLRLKSRDNNSPQQDRDVKPSPDSAENQQLVDHLKVFTDPSPAPATNSRL